eukprot:TRINITY_DN256_c0_g1_i9.p1 TRINITY_DN256_c0_g1~~TRINITY_DN256_c0_g1_i9.p1  ORF type:complete len:240 (-),score=-37.98 TRINITY_DN256_c0_g1_i9:174-893(-)
MQKARGQTYKSEDKQTSSHCLQANGFRYYFTPLTGVLFTFPSRYWFTIGHWHVFSLGRWSSRIPTGFHVSRRTWVPHQEDNYISLTGLSPSTTGLSRHFQLYNYFLTSREKYGFLKCGPTTPHWQRPYAYTNMVWADPRSLAATWRIAIAFFSWGQLDVSVHPVTPTKLCIHLAVYEHYPIKVSQFRNLRFIACLTAHRSFSQSSTPFIVVQCLGIHRLPLVAWSQPMYSALNLSLIHI